MASAKDRHLLPWQHAVAGVTAGSAANGLLHPFDLLKTRMQAEMAKGTNTRYTSAMRGVRIIMAEDGARGFYKGVNINMLASACAWGGYFYLYTGIKAALRTRNLFGVAVAEEDGGGELASRQLNAAEHFLASGLSGAVVVPLTNPLWVIKTRMQVETMGQADKYVSIRHAVQDIARTEGLRGFYRGLAPAFIGVSHGALQFMAYEELKLVAYDGTDVSAVGAFGLGAASKIFASSATYPYQVIKSRLQLRPVNGKHQYEGVIATAMQTYRTDGVRGFYRGIMPNIVRVTPASACTFLIYETIAAAFLRGYEAERAELEAAKL